MDKQTIQSIYNQNLFELIFSAQSTHRKYHKVAEIQKSTLISIKTGKCPENCRYCSQSAHYDTPVENTSLMSTQMILSEAKKAKENGSTRFCIGSSGSRVRDGEDFNQVLDTIKKVKTMGLETCATLGMLSKSQADRLAKAGLDYYNHNLDTSSEYYSKVVTTRTYEDRIDTIKKARNAGMSICSGGILGMGEVSKDRISLLFELSNLDPYPESVTINQLVPVEGTPFESYKKIESQEVIRTIATARIIMPKSVIRLSAGRESMNKEFQLVCYLVGANSIFAGEKLLTTPNAGETIDNQIFKDFDLQMKK